MKYLVCNILKYEFLRLSRIERNSGFLIYSIGLPIISYIVFWTSNSLDSTLGLGALSICSLNLFYGPVQLLWDQNYYEGFFSKDFNFRDLIKGKLLLLQVANTANALGPLLCLGERRYHHPGQKRDAEQEHEA